MLVVVRKENTAQATSFEIIFEFNCFEKIASMDGRNWNAIGGDFIVQYKPWKAQTTTDSD